MNVPRVHTDIGTNIHISLSHVHVHTFLWNPEAKQFYGTGYGIHKYFHNRKVGLPFTILQQHFYTVSKTLI